MNNLVEIYLKLEHSYFIYWLGICCIFSFLFSALDILTFCQLFSVKLSKKKLNLTIITFGIIRSLIVIFIKAPLYRLCNIILAITIFKLFSKKPIENCIFGELINCVIIISPEFLVSKILLQNSLEIDSHIEGIYNINFFICLRLIIFICRLIILLILKFKNYKLNFSDKLSKDNKITLILASSFGCLVLFFNAVIIAFGMLKLPYYLFIINMFSILLYSYIGVMQVIRISKIENQKIQIENLESYNKTLSIMYDSVRAFKHDYYNFIQMLEGYTELNDFEGIKEVIKTANSECISLNKLSTLNPSSINHPAVYSILVNKHHTAETQNLSMTLEILSDLKNVNIDSYNLCRILGILIDNAIEAAKDTKEKMINIQISQTKNKKIITVENSYANEEVDLNEIFTKGMTTKTNEPGFHGLGLWTVKKIIKNNNSIDLLTSKGELFKQELIIYNEIA